MRLIFIRHGQTEWNVSGKLQGQLDIPLDEIGLLQSKLLCSSIKKEKVDIIFSSPLSRAINTGLPIANLFGLGIICTSLLSERNFGILQGFKPYEISKNLKMKKILEKTIYPTYRPKNGESLVDVQSRILNFFFSFRSVK